MIDTATAADAILKLLALRADGLTICPSEAARSVQPDAWRQMMPIVHDAAHALAAAGKVVLTQGGVVVPPQSGVGAYRIRKA